MLLRAPVSFPTPGAASVCDKGTGLMCPRMQVANGWYALVWMKDSAAVRRLSSLQGPMKRTRMDCCDSWLPLNVVAQSSRPIM